MISQGLNGDKPGRIGFKLGLTTDCLLVAFGPVMGLVLGAMVTLSFLSLALGFGGTRLLLTPSRPRFMMLAGVTGAIVSSPPTKSALSGSVMAGSLGEGDGLEGGGMEKSCPEGPAPAEFEVVDLAACFRTTAEAIDDLRLGAGLFKKFSSLGDALLLLEMAGAVGRWVYAPSHGLVRGETSKSVSAVIDVIWKAMLAGAEFDNCWMCGLDIGDLGCEKWWGSAGIGNDGV